MNTIERVFGRKRVLLPVIHVVNAAQALANAEVAIGAGGDGVWLINHAVASGVLIEAHRLVRRRYHDFWVGLNFLNSTVKQSIEFSMRERVSALWVDHAGLREELDDPTYGKPQHYWQTLQRARDLGQWGGYYFGGVAFKGQRKVEDPARLARYAVRVMDVVTTSGVGTGVAPPLIQIECMRDAMGPDAALAIASGITAENVERFLPLCDCFMVATGISDSHTTLNGKKTRDLAEIIHGNA